MKNPIANRTRAVNIVKSWLTAARIPVEVSPVPGMDLTVRTKEGTALQVRVINDDQPHQPDVLSIPLAWVNERRLSDALVAFHLITELAGYGQPHPSDRGEVPTKRAHFTDRFEDVALKHGQFRRAPNPAPEHLKHYSRTIESACWCFLRSQRQLCQDHMLELGDLITYASCWTIIFIARDELPAPKHPAENHKLLHSHLRQRFIDFHGLLRCKGRNIFPGLDDAFIAQFGTVYDKRDVGFAEYRVEAISGKVHGSLDRVATCSPFEPEVEEDQDYIERHAEIDTKRGPLHRRISADKLLTKKLAEMPHDQMVVALQAVIDEKVYHHPEAREEATRRLRDHAATCTICITALLPVNEELPDLELASAAE